jgi:hypothetical protein
MDAMIKLIARDGYLYIGDDIIVYVYPAGDADTIPWPMKSDFRSDAKIRNHLARALYDAHEMGDLPHGTESVLLPDGAEFNIAGNL